MMIYPVLLAGGSGSRLWPLSRKTYPKQFSHLVGGKTLFQKTAVRLSSSENLKFQPPIVVTNSDYRFIAEEQLQDVGIHSRDILIEPSAKNTAPAILAAALVAYGKDPNSCLLVAPTDHLIPNISDFHEAILLGLSQVRLGKMVTFGILPTHPETGYGYLEISGGALNAAEIHSVKRFVEKPPRQKAEEMIKSGNFLWNAGIFLFKVTDIIAAFKKLTPNTLELTSKALKTGTEDLSFFRLNPEPWALIENVSIDYAIMEKVNNLTVVPYSSNWSDLGGWEAVWSEFEKDTSGNVVSEGAHAFDCSDSLLRTEHPNQTIVGIGLNEIVAVAMPDAVLVVQKDRAQSVRDAVEFLKTEKVPQSEVSPKEHRPWGWFESLALGERFQVKRICVKPGAALSLQSHSHRSEHWVVVEGEARVTVNDSVQTVSEGQSVYVPLGAIHRMENLNAIPTVLIEVQIGSYLGEDDIIRYEDLYSRD